MLRSPLTRLVSAVTVAGALCAAGAGAASAAPAVPWSGPGRPVPGALTNDSPALSTITFPNPIGQGVLVAWRGRGVAGHVFYKYRTNARARWSRTGVLSGALTSSAPAIAAYTDPLGRGAVLLVWAGHADSTSGTPRARPGGTARSAGPSQRSCRRASPSRAPSMPRPFSSPTI